MPRIRSIKPQFWLDEKLGGTARDVRLLYIGLWNLSDDRGVFEYRPMRIKAQLFPYDEDITEEIMTNWLNALINTGDIVKFVENGKSFGYIPTFLVHQPIEKPSKWTYTTTIPVINPTQPLPDHSPTGGVAESLENRVLGSKEEVLRISNSDSDDLNKSSKIENKLDNNRELKSLNKYPPEFTPLRKQIFAGLKKLRGYNSPKPIPEAKAISEMLKEHTPEEILKTWNSMKADKFWQDKELFMMSVKSQIKAIIKNNGSKPNGENLGHNQKDTAGENITRVTNKYTSGNYGQLVQQ
jgi:hypothetical protein